MTENERIWQFLDSHKQEFLDYWSAQLEEASNLELVTYDPEKMTGILVSYSWQGVNKLVAVSPDDFLDFITSMTEDVIAEWESAVKDAKDAAAEAKTQAEYAEEKGDRASELITTMEALEENVELQTNRAKNFSDNPPEIIDGWWYCWSESQGKKVPVVEAEIDISQFTQEELERLMERSVRPHVSGTTLVFPAVSDVSVSGTTLILNS